jgi:hypothetical protein
MLVRVPGDAGSTQGHSRRPHYLRVNPLAAQLDGSSGRIRQGEQHSGVSLGERLGQDLLAATRISFSEVADPTPRDPTWTTPGERSGPRAGRRVAHRRSSASGRCRYRHVSSRPRSRDRASLR